MRHHTLGCHSRHFSVLTQAACCVPADDRQLPQFPAPGGLFGGLMGGLVNQAVKGLAKEMQKTAAETRR
jgi:hypothetical protein